FLRVLFSMPSFKILLIKSPPIPQIVMVPTSSFGVSIAKPSPKRTEILSSKECFSTSFFEIWNGPSATSPATAGYDVIWRAVRNIFNGQVFDENFLMTIATLAAFYVQEYPEAVAVMLFYQVGEVFQDVA